LINQFDNLTSNYDKLYKPDGSYFDYKPSYYKYYDQQNDNKVP